MMNQYAKADFWTKKAFSEGYPARSVYKLEEINKKFKLFSPSDKILDLGAAPGSWTSFVLRRMTPNAMICAVDLKPLAENIIDERLHFFQGDLYSKQIIQSVKELGPYNAVICDAAPATTGNKTVDTARSLGLVELAVFYAQEMLVKGGNFTVKIFQGGDRQQLLKDMRNIFDTVKTFKPQACRSSSFETYLIGLNRK
ncbi:SAM-dependent methyltransferase [Treponema phagedenis]|uniref:SAM-dependent methyltransferase n=1 Tax=Treponema phagedenis TaxID=162 RepID=UPI0001F63A97|nr:RlmE family RNA methyltransferase [Treponema phagedenis]EFW38868.1 ribosomal RNA large subunit methyltransferase J [Treponema phagedenis F0421]TYT78738.1 RlmE family RNA methyltransferase [Treponema phagedenis]